MPKSKKSPTNPKSTDSASSEAELTEAFDKRVESLISMGAQRSAPLREGWTLNGCIAIPPRLEVSASSVAPRDLIEYTHEGTTVSGMVATITVDTTLGVIAYTFETWPGHYPPAVLMVPVDAAVIRIG